MIGVYTADEIRRVEREAFASGETEDALIDRAAAALTEETLNVPFDRAVIFVGGGNNGSDALSLALELIDRNRKVVVCLASRSRNRYVEKRLETLRKKNADVREICSADELRFDAGDLIVDGMLGIGCARNVVGLTADIINKINAADCPTLSVDIPTGLNADTGRAMGACVEADLTVTFSAIKQGLLLEDGRNYAGKIIVRSIGLPLPEPRVRVIEATDITLPKRRPVSNKGTYGNVKIVAGSPTMMGASLLAHESALAALRSGAGYAVLCVPDSLKAVYQSRVKEELLCFLPDDGGKIIFDTAALDGVISKAKSIVIGMGLGANDDLIKIIEYLSHNFGGTLVVDGDGLNALARAPRAVAGHKCKLILTPHVLEFARLEQVLTPHVLEFARLEQGVMGTVSDASDTDRCAALAARLGAVVAMKSATTVISDGSDIMLNISGTPAMAKAGSGDVLGGMVGAFASTSDPLTATLRACYEFGKAGERAAADLGETSVLASDVIVRI